MKLKTCNRARWEFNSWKQFNDRRVQNCKRYDTTNNAFSFSISLQYTQHQKFSGIFTENRKTVKYVTETVKYRALFLWANLHTKCKNAKSLDEFKPKIKTWKFFLKEFVIDKNQKSKNRMKILYIYRLGSKPWSSFTLETALTLF